jgi:hypothetical protein
MRTTLTIDDDLLAAARALADTRHVSVGQVISDLIRRGLANESTRRPSAGFPVFKVSRNARPITLADVKKQEDEG